MDRPLTPAFLKRQNVLRGLKIGGAVLFVVIGITMISGWLHPSVNRNRIRTAKVEVGPMEASITATGTVVPEFEQVLSSPIDTRVLKVLKKPGDVLAPGDAILGLDLSGAQLEYDKLNDQITLKQNQQTQLKIDLDKTLSDLQTQLHINKLRLEFLQSKSAQQQELFAIGGSSKEQLRQSKLEEEIAALELTQLETTIRNTEQSLKNQLEGVATEISILQKERSERQHQLSLAGAKADRAGVLTFTVTAEGTTIRKGDVLARIADLNAFRVDVTVSDIHAHRLAVDMPAKVKVNEAVLTGKVAAILPAVENGIMTMHVSLDDKASKLLRSNLRVDVYLITAFKERVLRVKKGPFVNGEGAHEAFVVRDGVAIKTPIGIGLASFDYYEVTEGLAEGEEVIISDMQDFIHMDEVKVK
ncbi:HlyD family efflux transporter periplasmic adaptor subunit [candidate division KSB1 bacterium]|nr:HlyD family efflux transporter periplasmic adaptor subunit [candidate division KSB1 bacterium]